MIANLRGILLEKTPPLLLVDVQGVGYEVNASMSTFYRLPAVGEEVNLLIHFVVREDAQLLFGFATSEERILFRALIKVNGVGPKVALTILSSIEPSAFVRCILDHDVDSLVRLPGIGKKTAERLLIEMRDRCGEWNESATENNLKVVSKNSQVAEAINALVGLGYKPQEASRMINKVESENLSVEEIIRNALRSLAKC